MTKQSKKAEKVTMPRVMTGRVISNKGTQSIVVMIERKVKHERFGKYIKKSTKLMAHDEKNECQIGDTVIIEECRPLSKRKCWMLTKIKEKAQ